MRWEVLVLMDCSLLPKGRVSKSVTGNYSEARSDLVEDLRWESTRRSNNFITTVSVVIQSCGPWLFGDGDNGGDFEAVQSTIQTNSTSKGVLFYNYMINNVASPPLFAPNIHCLIVVACLPEQQADLKAQRESKFMNVQVLFKFI